MSTAMTAQIAVQASAVPIAAMGETAPPLASWLAKIQAPIHGRKVPTIHQTG